MILSAAEAIIGEAGGAALTARSIAGRIGYSPGTLYNLFEDLEDVVVHVNARTLDALYEVCVRVAKQESPEATLRAYAKAYIRFTARHERRWALLLSDRSPLLRSLPAWYQQKVDRLLAFIEAAIAPLFRSDQTRERRRAAQILWASLHGISALARIEAVGGKPSDLTDDLIATYLLGLRRSQGGKRSTP